MRQRKPKERPLGPYEVGYGRPPMSTRFKPGQSGNPKGRPKGAKNWNEIANKIANTKVPIQENGTKRLCTMQEAIMISLFIKAIKGDISATRLLMSLPILWEPGTEQSSLPPPDTSKMTTEEIQQIYFSMVRGTATR